MITTVKSQGYVCLVSSSPEESLSSELCDLFLSRFFFIFLSFLLLLCLLSPFFFCRRFSFLGARYNSPMQPSGCKIPSRGYQNEKLSVQEEHSINKRVQDEKLRIRQKAAECKASTEMTTGCKTTSREQE